MAIRSVSLRDIGAIHPLIGCDWLVEALRAIGYLGSSMVIWSLGRSGGQLLIAIFSQSVNRFVGSTSVGRSLLSVGRLVDSMSEW